MTQTNTIRKKRVDRNHIIYELRVAGGNYIGVTAKTESTINKSVLARAAKHYYRAKKEAKDWALCHALRTLSDKSEIEVLIIDTYTKKERKMTFTQAMVYISQRKEADGSGLLETLQYMQDNLDEFEPVEQQAFRVVMNDFRKLLTPA